MRTIQEYLDFLMRDPKVRLSENLKHQLEMILKHHFEEESGQWVRRQLDRIKQYENDRLILPDLLKALELDWAHRTHTQ